MGIRVPRGGNRKDVEGDIRSAFRDSFDPVGRSRTYGFRLVRS
jgi:formylglycine-generating enzyme required for sulfatase activity